MFVVRAWKAAMAGLGLVLCLVQPSDGWAETLTAEAAVNKAGRQRMLSQRMVKAYCQVGLKIQPEHSRKILDESVRAFESQLGELRQFAVRPEVKAALDNEAAAWAVFKPVVTAPPTREGAQKLMHSGETLLQASNHVTELIEQSAGSHAGRLVNVAGRQRMLSQRLAKFYMLRRWGFTQPEVGAGMEQARKEMVAAFQELGSAPQNTPRIRDDLELARSQWVFFDAALVASTGADDATAAGNVATSSEHILEVMDQVTGLYEKLGAK